MVRTHWIVVLAWVVMVCPRAAVSCSSFAYSSNQSPMMGKSYDWMVGHGAVVVNKRGMKKTALIYDSDSEPVKWTSQYGSVTFNQHGLEFPVSGINEKGLAIEVLWGDMEAPDTSDPRSAINEIQWVQYQLDRFQNVDEVVSHASEIRIEAIYADVHYFICDALNQCATMEYLGKKWVINRTPSMTVTAFTNTPYADLVDYLLDFKGFGGTHSLPKGTDSYDRFVRVSMLAKRYQKGSDPVAYGFKILDSVPKSKGWPVAYTQKWRLVYELSKGIIHFETNESPGLKQVDLTLFDYSCATPVMMLDMDTSLKGDISKSLEVFSKAENRRMVDQNWFLSQDILDLSVAYPEKGTECVAP